jgi:L-asparaginase/Glu-tRNA(Gln) amidotransferase subunit D
VALRVAVLATGGTIATRIALAALLCVHDDADAVRAASTEYVDPTTRPPDRPPVARARG